jgi:dihydrofolate reductase
MISIIVAVAKNRAIGACNALLWRLSNDMKRFKELTTGHTIIMGRKTFESLPKGALPNRKNVIVSRHPNVTFKDCEVFNDLTAAIERCKDDPEVFIIGGGQIYKQALPYADKLYITYVHHTFDNADAFFPVIDAESWMLSSNEDHPADEKNTLPYSFQTYIRKK